jgi:hypothetical protein
MRGKPIVAVYKETGKLIPIDHVKDTGLKCGCICYDCDGVLEAVLNTERRKHFRHSNKTNCNPTPESQLHLLAKVIIGQNNRILLPVEGMVDYSDPVIEVRCGDMVPDAIIRVDGELVYVEIVVTNPIHPLKAEKYRLQQAKVLVIRLTEEDRDLDFETLKHVVLEDAGVRELLSYTNAEQESNESSIWVASVIGVVGIGVFLWNRFGRRRRR